MSGLRLWPRNLPGQMALLVAIALFVAQAINGALLLGERRALRLEQIAAPAITRIIDAGDRIAQGRPIAERGRVRRAATNPVAPDMPGERDVERAIGDGLAEANFGFRRVVTGLRPLDLATVPPRLRARVRAMERPQELVIAVEQANGTWLVQRAFWPHGEAALMWRLLAQTLILYGAVLLPVLWITRRIAQPLATLTAAAQSFGRGDPASGAGAPPLAANGPHDVAVLIEAFNALRLRVTAMLEEKDRMLGAIGHDLRTPLAALRVRVESVEDETDRTRMAATIAEMNQTLDDILSLARVGRPGEPVVEVDLPALVDAVAEDFRDLGHAVRFDAPPRLTVRLRPVLMRRALRNLVENAIKYGHNATVAIENRPGSVAVIVTDSGPGIPPDRIAEVFAPFTRLEGSRNRETGGIGLGLALARAIVQEAGGTITLANHPQGGLAATIALPRRE